MLIVIFLGTLIKYLRLVKQLKKDALVLKSTFLNKNIALGKSLENLNDTGEFGEEKEKKLEKSEMLLAISEYEEKEQMH